MSRFMQFDWLFEKVIERMEQWKGITIYELASFCAEWKSALILSNVHYGHTQGDKTLFFILDRITVIIRISVCFF